jgi:hypothetical protein
MVSWQALELYSNTLRIVSTSWKFVLWNLPDRHFYTEVANSPIPNPFQAKPDVWEQKRKQMNSMLHSQFALAVRFGRFLNDFDSFYLYFYSIASGYVKEAAFCVYMLHFSQ